MFNVTDAELVTLGIGGSVLIAGLLIHFPDGSQPLTFKLLAIALAVAVGVAMLAVALIAMLTD